MDGTITTGRKQRIRPHKTLAKNIFRSLTLRNQEALVIMTDRQKNRKKWSKKVKKRMRELEDKRREIESNVMPCTSNFP